MKSFRLHSSYPGIIIFMFLLAVNPVKAAHQIDNLPVPEKFNLVKERAKDYNSLYWYTFSKLKPQIIEILDADTAKIKSLNVVISHHLSSIDSLIARNAATQKKLDKALAEKESLVFLGMTMQKTGYNFLLWGIIAILTLGLVMIFLFYKQSHIVTRATKNDLNELKMEFESFRKRALEREEGIVRKYHNELNKYKTKTGNLSK